MSSLVTSPRSAIQSQKSKSEFFIMFEGFWLILRSPYLIYISLFLWLSAVVSSVFYFQVWLFCICVLPCIIELVSLLHVIIIIQMSHLLLPITFSPWFSESDDSCYYNIKPNGQKENICSDKQLYSSFYSCGTTHFDGILHLLIILSSLYASSPNTLWYITKSETDEV